MKKSFVLTGLFLMAMVLAVSFVSAIWPFDRGDVQLQPSETTDVSVTVGNVAPTVIILFVDDDAGSPDDIVALDPTGLQPVTIEFTVEDQNGLPGANLNPATLDIIFDYDTGPETVSTLGDGACSSVDALNVRTYTCIVNMINYSPHIDWTATVQIDDTAGSPLTGSDTHAFDVGQLLDIDITSPLVIGAVAPGQQDVTGGGIQTTVTNNGNIIVPTDRDLYITAEELGSSPPGDIIPAASFNSAGSGQADVCGFGTPLVDASAEIITGVSLSRGVSPTNEETLDYCLDVPNIAEASYSATDGGGLWVIEIA
jgi:hypothetical protein